MKWVSRTALAIILPLLPTAAAAGIPELFNCTVEVQNPYPFTIAPCGGEMMPSIDVMLIDNNGLPIEVPASAITLANFWEQPCGPVIADSSSFAPDPGHTTFSGWRRMGLDQEYGCEDVDLFVLVNGNQAGKVTFTLNSPDLNLDGRVSVADFGLFAGHMNGADACADYNESGHVNVADFGIFSWFFNLCECE